jgi:hypothetical protein
MPSASLYAPGGGGGVAGAGVAGAGSGTLGGVAVGAASMLGGAGSGSVGGAGFEQPASESASTAVVIPSIFIGLVL